MLGVVLLALAPHASHAWGPRGHAAVALIAASFLSPSASAELDRVLGGRPEVTLPAVANWADEVRPERPQTRPWHFVDIPLGARGYLQWRDCRQRDCLIAAIDQQRRVAADREAQAGERREAVMFLVHLVADLHNPLHCANNADAGGNRTRVSYGGVESNLHRVWDGELFRWPDDLDAWSGALARSITPQDAAAWRRGSIVTWCNQSHALAVDQAYGRLRPPDAQGVVMLDDAYLDGAWPLAVEQLKRAGVRLAQVLNAALGD